MVCSEAERPGQGAGHAVVWCTIDVWCAVKQKDMAKAQDVLLQYEEEMLQPSARTLRFLARSLEREGMPVPFEVPDFQPVSGLIFLCCLCLFF